MAGFYKPTLEDTTSPQGHMLGAAVSSHWTDPAEKQRKGVAVWACYTLNVTITAGPAWLLSTPFPANRVNSGKTGQCRLSLCLSSSAGRVTLEHLAGPS